jgi:hypothetical protein
MANIGYDLSQYNLELIKDNDTGLFNGSADSLLALAAAIANIPVIVVPSFNVPLQNSAANVLERDVIGNKTDTKAGNSIVSLLLQSLAAIALTATEAEAVIIFNELEASLIASGAGSNATNTALGSLVRWLVDNVGLNSDTSKISNATYGLAALDTEVEASQIATGAGSNATKTALGSLVRWLVDNVQSQILSDATPFAGGQVTKLHGAAPTTGSTTANWNTAPANICQIGSAGVRYKIHSLLIDLTNMTGNVTLTMTISINGNQRQIYPPILATPYVPGTNAPGVALINGTFGIANVLTIQAYSSLLADNGAAIGFEFMLEAM